MPKRLVRMLHKPFVDAMIELLEKVVVEMVDIKNNQIVTSGVVVIPKD